MVVDHSANSGRAPLSVRGDDLYETPDVATWALLRELAPIDIGRLTSGRIWEPACGPGAIARVLRNESFDVYATDLVDYASPDQDAAGRDFLMELELPPRVMGIITNPPYKLANQFVRHALRFDVPVVMLLRLAFLESVGRSSILEGCGLREVLLFRNRLPMMHRDGWTGKRAGSSIAFAWYVWDPAWRGETELRRISWEESDAP